MAGKIQVGHDASAVNLYAVFINETGDFWNGSAFESFNGSNWTTYDVALNEWGTSKLYRAGIPDDFPAGAYSWFAYERAGASPAQTDPIISSGVIDWDGDNIANLAEVLDHGDTNWATVSAATIAGAVLTNAANKLATDASGNVTPTASAIAAIATAVWAAGTRTVTSFGTLVSDIATAVGVLITGWPSASSIASAVWGAGARTLTAFSFTPNAGNVATANATIAKLETMLEADGPVSRFTTNALEQAPDSGDATAANQDTIIAAIADLAAVDAEAIAEAVMDAVVDGSLDARNALKRIASIVGGKCVVTDTDPFVLEFYNAAGNVVVATLTMPTDSSGRTVA